MRNRTFVSCIFVAALSVCSFILVPVSFAGTSDHNITIVNNSDTQLKPTHTTHAVVFSSTNAACTAIPPDACGQVNLDTPDTISPHASGVVKMTGPTGCNIASWQSYWTLDLKGKNGTVQCGMTGINVCNNVTKNFTCTITQANVDAVKGNGNSVRATAQ